MPKMTTMDKIEAFESSPSAARYALWGAGAMLFAMLLTLIFMD